MGFRLEKDFLGSVKVPSEAYYGAQTQRAKENFPISGHTLQKEFFKTYALVKRAAAVANKKIGKLDARIAKAIIKACDEILSGKFSDQFVVDVYQAGAGTSTNMNLNEVIANRASEILGKHKGSYFVHPNDHVNLSQSTNDTFHTTLHITAYKEIHEKLLPALKNYQKVLNKKIREFAKILKSGRTHLMDAVPLTLGQEFSGFVIERRIKMLERASKNLLLLPMGGTAVGTGVNASKHFTTLAIKEICRLTGFRFQKDTLRFASMQNLNAELDVSSALRTLAVHFIKVANDIRLLSSSAIGEIILPAVQPGSSIMPGKINPSIPEMLNMVCFQVIGNDLTITLAAQAGQLELNVFMPVVAYNLLNSIEILSNAVNVFTKKCLSGIKPDKERIKKNLENNPMLLTTLTQKYGYEKVAEVVTEIVEKRKGVSEALKLLEGKK
jgi:fumarate hydratase class II